MEIHLEVKCEVERNHVAIVDHLPAGWEPINPHLGKKFDRAS